MSTEDYKPTCRTDLIWETSSKTMSSLANADIEAEDFILGALRCTKMVASGDRGEMVGMRMETYILQDDPIRQDQRFIEAMRHVDTTIAAKESANGTAKILQTNAAAMGENVELDEIMQGKAMPSPTDSTHGISEDDNDYMLLKRYSWMSSIFTTAHLRALKDMGMYMEECDGYLQARCKKHGNAKPFCVDHVKSHWCGKGHSSDGDMEELAQKYVDQYDVKSKGKQHHEDHVLTQFFGKAATLIKLSSGKEKQWMTGQGLGRTNIGPKSFTIRGLLNSKDTPELLKSYLGAEASTRKRRYFKFENSEWAKVFLCKMGAKAMPKQRANA